MNKDYVRSSFTYKQTHSTYNIHVGIFIDLRKKGRERDGKGSGKGREKDGKGTGKRTGKGREKDGKGTGKRTGKGRERDGKKDGKRTGKDGKSKQLCK